MVHIDLFRNETEFDSFSAGATIFSEGDQGKLMYVVLDGQVRLSVKAVSYTHLTLPTILRV